MIVFTEWLKEEFNIDKSIYLKAFNDPRWDRMNDTAFVPLEKLNPYFFLLRGFNWENNDYLISGFNWSEINEKWETLIENSNDNETIIFTRNNDSRLNFE